MEHFVCGTTVRTPTPSLPYEKIKTAILGPRYALSLTLVGAARARTINAATRNKTYTPNVLSFPLDETHGEIYLTPQIAKREAPRFDRSYRSHLGYLFIHGCLHLKGYEHGPKMEARERAFMEQFRLS